MNDTHEIIDGYIRLGKLGMRLPVLDAYRASSAVFWVKPDFLSASMTFIVGNAAGSGIAASIPMQMHPSEGLWRAFIPATALTAKCQTTYAVVASDENGGQSVRGEGILRVHDLAIPPNQTSGGASQC